MKSIVLCFFIAVLLVFSSCNMLPSQIEDFENNSVDNLKEPIPSSIPKSYENSSILDYLKQNEIYVLNKFPIEYALGILAESEVEIILYFGINGYNPTAKDVNNEKFDLNVIKLIWTLPDTCDADAAFERLKSKDPSRTFLDDQQRYLSDEYKTNNGNIMRNIYWSQDGCLFTLTLPEAVFEEITSVDMLSVIKTSEVEDSENNNIIGEDNFDDPLVSSLPNSYIGENAEEFIQEEKLYVLDSFPFDYSLIKIHEYEGQGSAYFSLGKSEKIAAIDEENTMILIWTDLSPWDLDVHEYMKDLMSLEPGMKYLNDNEKYMFYDFENSDGIPRRMFYWGEDNLLFSLTIPVSFCDKITSVDMLSVSMTSEIDVVEPILETQDIDIFSQSSEINSESDSSLEPVAGPPES